jgi:uncharacterized protein (DUF58 family)
VKTDDSTKQITSLLGNDQLARVQNYRLNASYRFTNRSRGEHLRGRSGNSTEFSDYRNYSDGDDIRYVDWNIFARLRKPYLKQFYQEEEMHVVILIDVSASMDFEDKLFRAKQVGAACAMMGLMGDERVSVHAFGQSAKETMCLRPVRGRGSMAKVFRAIEEIEPGGDVRLEEGVMSMLAQHRGRGVVILLSDFLTQVDLLGSFNRLFSAGLELFAMQLLGPTEIAPELAGDRRLVDAESSITLDISAGSELHRLYHEYRLGLQKKLGLLCRQRGGRFLSVNTEQPLDDLLLDVLPRGGWVR